MNLLFKKTVFALALLANLNVRRFAVQALVVCPTRELADQVTQEVRRLARAEDHIKVLTLCGGATMRPQLASLEHGAHIVIGPRRGLAFDAADVAGGGGVIAAEPDVDWKAGVSHGLLVLG